MKYVYRRKEKGRKKEWYAQVYDRDERKLRTIGVFDTAEQAHRAQLLAERGHHWQGMPQVIPKNVFGFTYVMTHRRTGRMYLGAKQLLFWAGPQGGWKVTNPEDPEFDRDLWVESDWREYTSSSKVINAIVDKEGPEAFTYEVVELHSSKLELFYSELKQQMDADVLNAVDDDGNYIYYNEQIMGQEYRPKAPRAKLLAIRDASAKKMQEYYLNPRLCSDCGAVIPYGDSTCPGKPVFGNGGCNERAANG